MYSTLQSIKEINARISSDYVVGLRAEQAVLQPRLFVQKVQPQEKLGYSSWLNRRKEWWDGKLLVFTLPQQLAEGNNLAAVQAQLGLTRLTSMLRHSTGTPCTCL